MSTPVRILWTNAIMSKMKPAGMAIKGPWNRHGARIDEVNENPCSYPSLSTSNTMREKPSANKAPPHMHLGPIWGRCSCSFWSPAVVQTQKSRECNSKTQRKVCKPRHFLKKRIVKRCTVKWFQRHYGILQSNRCKASRKHHCLIVQLSRSVLSPNSKRSKCRSWGRWGSQKRLNSKRRSLRLFWSF